MWCRRSPFFVHSLEGEEEEVRCSFSEGEEIYFESNGVENQTELKRLARMGQLIFVGKMNIAENHFDISQQMAFQVFKQRIFHRHRISAVATSYSHDERER